LLLRSARPDFQLVPRLGHLGFQPLRLALQGRQTLFALRCVVAGVAGQGQQMHGVAAAGFQFPFRSKNFFGRSARFLLARLHLLAKGAGLFSCRL